MKHFLLAFFSVLVVNAANASYTLTKATDPNFCANFPTGYSTVSFAINETSMSSSSGFTRNQTNATLILGLSNASFQFNPGVGTVSVTGTGVTIVSYVITSTAITVTITTASTNTALNTINFNNIQIRATAAATGYIRRSGGTFRIDNKTTRPSTSTSWGTLTAKTPLAYSSSTATQSSTATVFAGTSDNQVIGIQVVVAGTCSSVTATSFNFNTTGSTNPTTDLTGASLYYTGTTNVFSTASLFGTVSNPNGSFAISGSQAFSAAGTYYFWLTYNINATATNANVVDVQLVSSVIGGSTVTPTTGNPTGTRTINTNYYYSINSGNWSSTSIWSRTSGGASCGCSPTTGNGLVYVNHSISLDNSYTVNNVTVQSGGILTNAASRILTANNNFTTSGTGVFTASTAWVLNNLTTAGTGTSTASAALTLSGSLNVGSGTTFQTSGGVALTVNGNLTVNGTLSLGTSTLNNSNAAGTIINGSGSITGSGTINIGVDKSIPSGASLTISPVFNIANNVTVTNNATVTMNNDITGGGTNAKWINAANAVLNMAGATSALLSTGTLDASADPNTVNYNGTGNQTIKTPSSSTYHNLYVASSGSGIKSLAGAIILNNDIQISTGAQLNAGSNGITLNGDWINNSTNFNPFSSTGTVTFNANNNLLGTGITTFNNIAIASDALLTSNSSTGKVIITGNWLNDGDFEHNNADITFNGTTTLSGASITAFNTVIVNASKTLTLSSVETDFEGNLTVNGTLNHNNGLVVFDGETAVQNINGSASSLTLYQMELDNNLGVSLSRALTVSNLLTLTGGNLVLGSNNLTIGAAAAAIAGSPFSTTNMIVASGGGAVIKSGTSAATASYTFPIGDNTGTVEYSPITLTFTSGTYTSGSASVKVVNAKHPNNSNSANYLTRYWSVSTTGYTVTAATVAVTYVDADIVGSESNILMGKWVGSNPWVNYSAATLNSATNTLTSPSLTVFGDFTGRDNAAEWTGAVSTDWAVTGNWDVGVVPTSLTNAVIPSTAVRMPSLVSSSSCNNLTINSGATITNTSSGTLNVAGTFTNNGTYTDNGTTVFNGTTGQQTFSGVSTFNNLTLNNASGLLLPAAITANGNILISAGTLNANNFDIAAKGNWTNNVSTTAFTAGTATVTFNGSTAQAIAGTFATSFNNLTISNAANTVTLSINASVAGNLSVTAGTFDLSTFTANRATSGGTLTVANNATLRIRGTNTYPSNYTTNTLIVASNVDYAGTNQTVANQTYGNLLLSSSSGAAVKTFPGSSMTILGNLTSSVGSGTSVSFTAAANITINGNFTIGASTTFNGASFVQNIGGNLVNNGTYNGNTGTATFTGASTSIGGSGTQNFNNITVTGSLVVFSTGTIGIAGNLATSGAGSFTQASGGTMSMSGTSKTISGTSITIDNLTVGGTVSTVESIILTGNLTVSGTFTSTVGVITMSGTSKTISGAGTISIATLTASGTITSTANFSISTAFTVAGSFTASSGTATFTSNAVLSGTANLFDVNINGTSLKLSANSVLGIASILTITAGTLDVTSSTPNTVNFNGSGNQSINTLTYSNLTLSNGGNKTAGAGLTINNNLTIGSGATFIPGSFTHTVYVDWVNNGSFSAGSSIIAFSGSQNSNIYGATTFNELTINNASSTTGVTLQNNTSAAIVNMTLGRLYTGSNTLTITNTRNGTGYIYGNIQRSHSFTTGVSYAFEGPDNTINFSAVSSVTSVTVSVSLSSINDFPFGGSINRVYNIAVPAGTYTATLRLHYEDDELNGNSESSMALWRYNGSSWSSIGKTGNSTSSNYVEQSGLTNIINRWTCSDNSNVVQWNGGTSTDWNTAANWTIVQGSATAPPSATDIVNLGNVTFTNQPTISSAVTVRNIKFGSAQAVTLSMASGGSLSTGNIDGTWSTNRTHTINANNQTIAVNDLVLSDGTSGHAINLNIGTGTVTVAGSLTQSGAANIVFSGAGNLNIGDNYNYVNGTFTAGTGTVTYNGVLDQQVGAVTYYNLQINKSAATATVNSSINIGGNLTITAGMLDNKATSIITGNVTIGSSTTLLNQSVLQIGGNWVNNGTYTSNSTGTNVIFNGSGTQTISATTFNNLEFNKTVGSIAELTGDVTLKGNLVGTSGTLDIKSFFFNRDVVGGAASLADNATLIIGADNAPNRFANYTLTSGSTVVFNGTGTQHLALPGLVYGNIVFRNAGTKILYTSLNVMGDFSIETGATFDASSFTINLNGNFTNSGTFTPGTSTLVLAGTNKNVTGVTTFNRLTATGSYTILNDFTINTLLNITSTGSLTGGPTLQTTMNGDLINSGTLYTLGTTTYTGNTLQTLSLINAVQTVAITVNFNGSVAPLLNSTSSPQFGYLNINNTAGISPSVGWAVLFGLTVASGSSFNGGSHAHTIAGSLTNNGTITSSGSITFSPTTTTTVNLGSAFSSTGTVNFAGTGAMTVSGSSTAFSNVNITNTNAAGIAPPADWVMASNLAIGSGATLNAGSHTFSVAGNIVNNGTINSSTSTVVMNGTGTQDIYSASAFNNLTLNKASGTTTLSANATVNGTLNFVSGKIQTGTYSLVQPSTASVTGAAQGTGWVNGNLQKGIGTGSPTKAFEVGDNTSYTPVSLAFTGVATPGSVTAYTTIGDHASIVGSAIEAAASVNRTWTLTNNSTVFTSYNATFNFVAADVDAGASTSNFIVGKYNSGLWVYPAMGTLTATSSQALSVTSFGDFQIGQPAMYVKLWDGGAGTSNWGDAANWNRDRVPTSTDDVELLGANTIDVNVAAATKSLLLNNETLVLTVKSGNTLTVSGDLMLNAGLLNTEASFPTVSGTVNVAAGTVGFTGSGSQTIPAYNYNNLTSSSSGARTLASSGTIGIAGTFTPGSNSYTTTGSTILFNGAAQTVPSFAYNNLSVGGTGIKTLASNLSITGNMDVASSLNASTYTITPAASTTVAITGVFSTANTNGLSGASNAALSNANAFTLNLTGSTVEYTAAIAQTVTPRTDYNNVTFSGAATKSLSGNITIGGALKLSVVTDKLSIGSNTLTINGTVDASSVGYLVGSASSNISVGGSGVFGTLLFDQTTPDATNMLQHLTLNRGSFGTVQLGNAMRLTGVITPTAGTLASSGYLTLASTASNTARVAAGSSTGGYITGDVTVERYISALNNRAYRLLTSSVNTSTTINANWQEGQANPNTSTNMPSAKANYGTHITGTGGSANGFDATVTNQASLFTLNPTTVSWDAVTNTTTGTMNANTGYLLFVRGNRDNINVLTASTPSSNTTLRATGTLPQGDWTFNGLSSNTAFSLVTNPYASPIIWDNATGVYSIESNAINFENYITIWDPNIGTRGGYVTVNTSGTTGGGATNVTNEIQSGQAFFVQTKTGVTSPALSLVETNKSTTNNLDIFRSGTQTETLKTFLYFTNGTGRHSADGVTSLFNNNYSAVVDGNDAIQIDNWDEDVAISRASKSLSIEQRPLIDENDTIFLSIARMKVQAYEWEFQPSSFNAPGMQAYLEDAFTGTATVISLSSATIVPFTVTSNTASAASNRFRILFRQQAVVPVSILNVNAYKKGQGIQVDWTVLNEINMDGYEVEKSVDGVAFNKVATVTALNGSSGHDYGLFDANPVNGDNYYRIRSIEKSGSKKYSQVVKVAWNKQESFVRIHPNPVVGNTISLQFNNIAKGSYQLSIVNKAGQTVFVSMLEHQGGTASQLVKLNGLLSNGTYQLMVIGQGLQFSQAILKQ